MSESKTKQTEVSTTNYTNIPRTAEKRNDEQFLPNSSLMVKHIDFTAILLQIRLAQNILDVRIHMLFAIVA